jgi:signal transduction histidine kinase
VTRLDYNLGHRVLSAAETALVNVLADERQRSQDKDLLLQVLLHELGNIGTAVIQGLELAQLGLDHPGNTNLFEGMSHARRAAHRFSRIAQDLRVLLNEQDYAPMETMDLVRFVREESLNAGRVRFSEKCPEPVRRCSPVLVRHIVSNLVGNALRYTTEPDSVFVGIRGGEEIFRISVGSRGAELSDGLRQSLFVPGHEGDHPRRGSGLGLYVSHRCALRHDGWIAFRRSHGFNVFTAFLHAPAAA